MPEPAIELWIGLFLEIRRPRIGASQTCSSSPCCCANCATNCSSSSDSLPRSLWLTCATESTIPNSARNSTSRQSKATESAPPETAAATRSPARIESCFRIVFNSRSAKPCTEKWYSSCQLPVPSCQWNRFAGNWVLATCNLQLLCCSANVGSFSLDCQMSGAGHARLVLWAADDGLCGAAGSHALHAPFGVCAFGG